MNILIKKSWKTIRTIYHQIFLACGFIMIGFGRFLKMIFCLTKATTLYAISLVFSLSVSISSISSWGWMLLFCFFITAYGLSSFCIFPVITWCPHINCGVPFQKIKSIKIIIFYHENKGFLTSSSAQNCRKLTERSKKKMHETDIIEKITFFSNIAHYREIESTQ